MAARLTRPEALRRHIRDATRRRLTWGVNDCATWACDWVLARAGVDPAAHLRGRYDSARGYLRLAVGYGGFVAMLRDAAARAGLVEIDPADAAPGDIGLIPQPGSADGCAVALRTPSAWVTKTADGAGRCPHAFAAWRVPDADKATD